MGEEKIMVEWGDVLDLALKIFFVEIFLGIFLYLSITMLGEVPLLSLVFSAAFSFVMLVVFLYLLLDWIEWNFKAKA